MAEREGFEPPIPVKVCPLSRRIVSTTHAPLRDKTVVSVQLLTVSNPLFVRNDERIRQAQGHKMASAQDVVQRLTAISEESLQQPSATSRQNAAPNLHAVIQLRMIHNLYDRMYRPGLGIIGPIDQPLNPRVH